MSSSGGVHRRSVCVAVYWFASFCFVFKLVGTRAGLYTRLGVYSRRRISLDKPGYFTLKYNYVWGLERWRSG